MRFNKLDLNLLVALDALLAESSITRAAERLNMSPSATSSALARLREYFDDELLVQVGRRMEPTPRAEGLRAAVRDVLLRVESTIALQPAFDARASDRTFRIFVSDYTQLVFVPHLLAQAARQGSNVRLEFLPQVARPQRSLERGEADLLIIPSDFTSPDHPSETLYEEDFCCVLWRENPLAEGVLTRERYLAAGHVVMQPTGTDGDSYEHAAAKRLGVQRRVMVVSFGFAPLPAMVVGTPLIATVQRRLALRLQAAWPVVLRPCPLPLPPMQQALQWHRYRTQDPGLVWLRQAMRDAVGAMDATAPAGR